MNKKTLGNVLAILAVLCFVAAIIGMASNGSHRWVEPLQEASGSGWLRAAVTRTPGKRR